MIMMMVTMSMTMIYIYIRSDSNIQVFTLVVIPQKFLAIKYIIIECLIMNNK